MPIHDWTRIRPGRFHHFHQCWVANIAAALNTGLLPPDYFALLVQKVGGREPEDRPLRARLQTESEAANYTRRADRLSIRNEEGELVVIIEIVSPGNKDSRHALREFTRKAVQFLRSGVHLLIVDLFPPSRRDPQGIHKAIWDRVRDEPFELPPDKPLTVAAYSAGTATRAYVEPVAVGDRLPDMPIFLTPDRYVACPLDATYETTWGVFPVPLKVDLERPAG